MEKQYETGKGRACRLFRINLRAWILALALGQAGTSAHAWDDVGGGWHAERVQRQHNPDTSLIRLRHGKHVLLAEYDCARRMLLTYDLARVDLPVPQHRSASAMFDYACRD